MGTEHRKNPESDAARTEHRKNPGPDAAGTETVRSAKPAFSLKGAACALLLSILTGICSGAACVLFYVCTQFCDNTRIDNNWLLYLLPAAGLLIVFLYDHVLGDKDLSTGALYRHIQEGKQVSPWIAPLITLSTCLAYLTGGSVGRAGSALQIGGSISCGIIEKAAARFDPGSGRQPHDLSGSDANEPAESESPAPPRTAVSDTAVLLTACGMACGFTAILNTPLAGAVFGVEVLVLNCRNWILIIPTMISSWLTWGIAYLFRISYTDFTVDAAHFTGLDPAAYVKLVLLAFAATLTARLFCYSRRSFTWAFNRFIKNPFIRVLAGTVMVVMITKLIGTMDCNGVGFTYVAGALNGNSSSFAFLWKLLLTVLTLSCGIRGGEIAPNIFIGAAFGCAAAPLIGLDPCLGAAVCLVGQLSSVTNCTLAVFLYGCEAMCAGLPAIACFALVSVIAHVFSGDIGLYREQPAEKIPLHLHIW